MNEFLLTLIELCPILVELNFFLKIKWVCVVWDCWLIRESMLSLMRTKIYLMRFEPIIDKLHFNLFFIVSNDLLCYYIATTCFKPIQDYIDIHDYMNVIEAIGWASIPKEPTFCICTLSEPLLSLIVIFWTFCFISLPKKNHLHLKKNKFLYT